MYSRIETITPEIAKQYLERNVKNRKKKDAAIRRYARDMRAGEWQLSPQGISFYENGNLADGQNRLMAVAQAGVPVEFYVTYGVPNESIIQDRGVLRSSADVLKMAGVDSYAATTNGVALANMLFELVGHRRVSEATLNDFITANEKTICQAISAANRTKDGGRVIAMKAPITAAAFCALYCGMDFDGLCDFFTSVNTGFYNGVSQTVTVVLRNFIEKERIYSSKERSYAFAFATNAIRDYAMGRARTRRYNPTIKPIFWDYTKKQEICKYLVFYKGD